MGIAAPFKRPECQLLLQDARIDLSPRGPVKVLMERIFEYREHIVSMLGLDRSVIEQVPTAAAAAADADDDPLLCAVCQGDASEERGPILKCDGIHAIEVGYHLDCLPEAHRLQEMPRDDEDWLCPQCCESDLWVVAEIRGKKLSHGGVKLVHYLCHWQGYDTDADTYEPLSNIPMASRAMVSKFNQQQRELAQQSKRQKK